MIPIIKKWVFDWSFFNFFLDNLIFKIFFFTNNFPIWLGLIVFINVAVQKYKINSFKNMKF